jgi:hypothetical protein
VTSFSFTNNCTSVAPTGTCTIVVRFTPPANTTTGAKAATLTIASNDPARPSVNVTLSGTATPAAISFTPASLTFGNQVVGTASAIQTLTLTNTGNGPVTTTSVTVGGPNANQFTVNVPAGCVRTRNAGAAFCNITVRFTPTAASGAGVKTATITVASTAGTVVANLTGTATTVATIGALPANVAFGRRAVGSSTSTTLTVTNTGSAPLVISAATVAGNAAFSASLGTCNVVGGVAPGASCQLTLTFNPLVNTGGTVTATLTITSNASNNPRTVTLTGRAP